MAGAKETPRQRMIGMMYLVLTALLALNVSKEIVNAFVRLNDKIEDSNRILQSKIDQDYGILDNAMAVKYTRIVAQKWNDKAMQIKQAVDRESQYLFSETNALLKETEGQSSNWLEKDAKTGKTKLKPLMAVESKDDYDAATRIFVGGNPEQPIERGLELRNHLQKLRDLVCNVIGTYEDGRKSYHFNSSEIKVYDPHEPKTFVALKKALEKANPVDTAIIARIYRTLSYPAQLTEYDETTSWQGAMFDHAPVVAAAAILTSLRGDIKTAEALALDLLVSKITGQIIPINKIEPVAFAPKGYLNVGDTMPLRVMIAAYDSNDVSKIKYAENPELQNASEQTGPISIRATSPGVKTVYGNIAVKERGELVWKPWSFTYEVGQPSASISPTDLNILYAGSYDNNITATASGYSSEDITLTGSGVAISKSKDGYIVKVPFNRVGSTVKLTVMANGRNVGSMDFRVRKTPKPLSFFGTVPNTESYITKSQLISALNTGVWAGFDQNSPIKGNFKVNSYKVKYSVNGADGKLDCATGKFSLQDIQKLNVLKSGASITIHDISCTGPSGVSERAAPIVLTIR